MAASIREPSWSSIPTDIVLKIAILLEVASELFLCFFQHFHPLAIPFLIDCFDRGRKGGGCVLFGSCSRFWRGICFSDWLWMELAKRRWPALDLGSASRGSYRFNEVVAHQISPETCSPFSPGQRCHFLQGWRETYIYKHQSLAISVSALKEFVEQNTQNESLEVGYYLKAVSDLHSYQFGFMDVQFFLFSKSCNALLNLIGLHYCLLRLVIPQNEVVLALHRNRVSEREVCVRLYKLGRWFYGFRLHDEHRSQKISLGDLAMGKGDGVLAVLNRGAIHEVIRVHIAPADGRDEASSSCTACEN